MSLWASFVIEAPGGRIYCVADSAYGRHFRDASERHGPFRLAILPIGAYEPRWFMRDQHINPAKSVQAFVDRGAEIALGRDPGAFANSPTNRSMRRSLRLPTPLEASGISPDRFRTFSTWAGVATVIIVPFTSP